MEKQKIDTSRFLVPEGATITLSKWPTYVNPFCETKEEYQEFLDEHIKKLNVFQNMLYAQNEYALLMIFQGMDAAGKDGAIRHVMSGVNPQGCQVFSFKHPSVEELEHDFLWRTTRDLPERGKIGIFNRSYYEEVLIARVHPEILRTEAIPEELKNPKTIWEKRYRSIFDLERHLHHNGTRIIKFFLHLSKDEQRKRFLQRIEQPEKSWKLSAGDIEERKYWREYMHAYEACLGATSTMHAPWHIVPADDKPNARLIISQIILDVVAKLNLSYPAVDAKRRKELRGIEKLLKR